MVPIRLLIFWLCFGCMSFAPAVDCESLLKQTCSFYDSLRTPNGLYLDSYHIDAQRQKNNQRVSIATTGIGLIALCVEQHLDWSDNRERVIDTLSLLSGQRDVLLERNKNGLFRHFVNWRNGESQSEFSSIDTALLMSGVIFCLRQFEHDEKITMLAKSLWESVDWSSCRGENELYFYMVQDLNGKGSAPTKLFNEYLLLADYCNLREGKGQLESKVLKTYHKIEGISVLSDHVAHPLPLFTFLFPLYLSPNRMNDVDFVNECLKAAKADRLWWKNQGVELGTWGSSAGTGRGGYVVNASGKNPDLIFHIPAVATYMPFKVEYKQDFFQMCERYPEAWLKGDFWSLPWRASLKRRDWKASSIQGIDMSLLLFGLTADHPACGLEFFKQRNRPPE